MFIFSLIYFLLLREHARNFRLGKRIPSFIYLIFPWWVGCDGVFSFLSFRSLLFIYFLPHADACHIFGYGYSLRLFIVSYIPFSSYKFVFILN